MIPRYGGLNTQMCFSDNTVSSEDREIAESYCEKAYEGRGFTRLLEFEEGERGKPYYKFLLGRERKALNSFNAIVIKDALSYQKNKDFRNYWCDKTSSSPVLVLFTINKIIGFNIVEIKDLILFEDFKSEYKKLYKI